MIRIACCLLLFCSLRVDSPGWMTDFESARTIAREQNKPLLLNFSGSDWCLPCMRLKKDIFESPAFTAYAGELVLVNADFPRHKKNKLSPEQEKKNQALASQFNPDGLFPLTLLLDSNNHVMKRWIGEVANADAFVTEIRNACTSPK